MNIKIPGVTDMKIIKSMNEDKFSFTVGMFPK